MGINIADNFAYNGKKPLDNRTEYTTLSAMKSVADANINEGCLAYNKEDGKYYKFLSTNTVDATTGKWREFSAGGGGGGHTIYDDSTVMTQRSGLEFVGFNVSDDSSGDKTIVSMPNIDLSMLSNEAFIFSATEKPVGMWTNRKLIYSKTVYVGALPNRTTTHTPHGISNIDEVVQCYGIKQYGHTGEPIPNNEPNDNSWAINLYISDTEIQIKSGQNQSIAVGYVVIFYTKTTDSPLPSDEKYAGLLANGTVVYKKTVASGGSAPSGTTLIYRLALLNSTDVVYFTR